MTKFHRVRATNWNSSGSSASMMQLPKLLKGARRQLKLPDKCWPDPLRLPAQDQLDGVRAFMAQARRRNRSPRLAIRILAEEDRSASSGTLKSDAAAERFKNRLSRDFWGRSIFDFCKNIGTFRTSRFVEWPLRAITGNRSHFLLHGNWNSFGVPMVFGEPSRPLNFA